MATPRLPFLYPNLMRAVKSCEPATYRSIRIPSQSLPPSQAPFRATRRYAQEAYHRRYGPAVEPNLPPPNKPKDESSQQQSPSPSSEKGSKDASPPEQSQQQDAQSRPPETPSQSDTQPATTKTTESGHAEDTIGDSGEHSTPEVHETQQASASPEESIKEGQQQQRPSLSDNPLDDVLHMPSPSSSLTPTMPSQQPNIKPAPYIHHFDTYTLVRDLAKGGFSEEQSITIMKAVRKILQKNLDFANQTLTSKSDVENESYLFKAACSELQSSMQTARNAEIQRQHASRTHLQHEADILSQRLNQELAGLKDDIKGMFNDHKMATRELQRSIDTSVQEINYKITVSLNSEAKSEIEGLRWILTRRAALAMATSAFMIILFLKYYSVRKQESADKKKETPPKPARPPKEISLTPKPPGPSAAHLGESLG